MAKESSVEVVAVPPTWLILLFCALVAICYATGAFKNKVVPVGPQPTPSASVSVSVK